MNRHLPPKGDDWLPNAPEQLANLIDWLKRQTYSRKADQATLQEHLAAAERKLHAVGGAL